MMPRYPRSRESRTPQPGFKDHRSRKLWRSGRVILKGQDKTDLRRRVFNDAGGRCEIEWPDLNHPGQFKRCNKFAPWDGLGHGELVHIVSSAHGGSDDEENCQWGCPECHKRRDHPGPQFAAERRRRNEAGENPAQPPTGLDANL